LFFHPIIFDGFIPSSEENLKKNGCYPTGTEIERTWTRTPSPVLAEFV
jgi:hypothetical protein